MVDWYSMCKKRCDFWCVMVKYMCIYIHMMVKGWRRKPSSFRHRAWKLLSSYMLVDFVERGREIELSRGHELSILRVKSMFASSLLNWQLVDASKPKNIAVADIINCIFESSVGIKVGNIQYLLCIKELLYSLFYILIQILATYLKLTNIWEQ